MMLVLGAIGLGSAIVIGAIGFIAQLFKPHPDASVLLACVSFMTSPLVVVGTVVYSRDRGEDDR